MEEQDLTRQSVALNAGEDQRNSSYGPEARTIYYGGYGAAAGQPSQQWHYPSAGGMAIYNENQSFVSQSSYGYNHQMSYWSCYPVATSLHNAYSAGVVYSPHFPVAGFYYQQPVYPGMSYITSRVPVLHPQSSEASNTYPQGCDAVGPPAVYPQPVSALRSFGHDVNLPNAMGSQQPQSLYGFRSAASSYSRDIESGGTDRGSNISSPFSGFGGNDQSRTGVDNSIGREIKHSSRCNEQDLVMTRGPRNSRRRNSNMESNSVSDEKNGEFIPKIESSNSQLEVATDYKDARFFIIKSYGEDNVHKSIKYGIWSSTFDGNRRLDAAYREPKNKVQCRVFLMFSVTGSGRFCGVAEMMGTVNFDGSVDYWQQEEWNAYFPLKWHLIKDVPMNYFRHIFLENNDKKPVTECRDACEVNPEQGLEMLTVFNNYDSNMSILDDFDFYEEREKVMQENKKQSANQVSRSATTGEESVEELSSSLAQVSFTQIRNFVEKRKYYRRRSQVVK